MNPRVGRMRKDAGASAGHDKACLTFVYHGERNPGLLILRGMQA